MQHMTEEELIAFREGVAEQRAVISDHLVACEECRWEFERIEAVLAALDMLPVPEPGAGYGRRGWRARGSPRGEENGRPVAFWRNHTRAAARGPGGAAD